MKDKKQIIVIVLLVVNLAATIFLFTGLQKINSNIQDVQDNMYYNLKLISNDINSQLEMTLLTDDFRVMYTEETFAEELNEGKKLEGQILFELTDNIDIETVHLIMTDEQTQKMEKVDVLELGALRYRANVALDYTKNYTYYILGETEDGKEVMLSEKHNLDLKNKMKDRVYMLVNTIYLNENRFGADGLIQVDSRYEIEKIEAVLIYYEEDTEAGTAQLAGELAKVDVTDSLVDAGDIDVDGAVMENMPEYTMYGFEFEKETEGYNGEEMYDLMLVVTFTDGAVVEVY